MFRILFLELALLQINPQNKTSQCGSRLDFRKKILMSVMLETV